MLEQLYRKAILTVSGQPAVEQLVRQQAQGLSERFVAGETVDSAIKAAKALAIDGIYSNFDLLGEFIDSPEKCNAFADSLIASIESFYKAQIMPYLSIKLSSLGQGQLVNGQDLGLHNARRILRVASDCAGFVCLDMEDHSRVDATLKAFRSLVNEFSNEHVGTVLQSYLYRSLQDRRELSELAPHLRFVKGAYLEPASVAYPDKADVDQNYRRLVFRHLKDSLQLPEQLDKAQQYTKIATHDERIIRDIRHFALKHGIPNENFEFQMLYGIAQDLQIQLVQEGYTVRAYIPYGRDWYAYFSRRIAETPRNALFVARGIMREAF